MRGKELFSAGATLLRSLVTRHLASLRLQSNFCAHAHTDTHYIKSYPVSAAFYDTWPVNDVQAYCTAHEITDTIKTC